MEHHFTVPVPIDVAWSALLDPERVAPCMPGATLTGVEDTRFTGSVKVKMGPVSLMYKGSGSFAKVDAERHRVVIEAGGKDARGNGTASATVTALLSPEDEAGNRTEVRVDTDLKVTGKPAQLGRGLISEVAGKLLTQFAECLAERLQAGEPAAAPAAPAGAETGQAAGRHAAPEHPATPNSREALRPGGAGSHEEEVGGSETSPSWQVTPGESGDGAASRPAGAAPTPPTARAGQPPGPSRAGERASERASQKADAVVEGEHVSSGEAIDLLGTAGAPMLKRLLPVLAVVGAVVGAVALARRGRHGRRGRTKR